MKIIKQFFISLLLVSTCLYAGIEKPAAPSLLAPVTQVTGKTGQPQRVTKRISIKELLRHPEKYFDFAPFSNEDPAKVTSHYKSIFYHLISNWSFGTNEASVDFFVRSSDGKIVSLVRPEFKTSLRKWLFSDLSKSLERLITKEKLSHPTRSEQLAFAGKAQPVIQKWMDENLLMLKQILPLIVEYPKPDEGYARNGADVRQRFGIFTHAWGAHGATDLHNHGGALAFTTALGTQFHEETFKSARPLDKPWDSQVIRLESRDKHRVPPGQVHVITRGSEAIHTIVNRGDQPAIMIEIYVWDKPFSHVNNPIPVDESATDYYVLHVPAASMQKKISERYEKEREIHEHELLKLLDSPEIYPLFTSENTAVIHKKQLLAYIKERKPRVFQLKEGPLLLEPARFIYSDQFLSLFHHTDAELEEDAAENAGSWKTHLDNSRSKILRAAGESSKKERALILGVGNGTEIPIAEIAGLFKEVVLVGMDREAMLRAINKVPLMLRHKITLKVRDISNDGVSRLIRDASAIASDDTAQPHSLISELPSKLNLLPLVAGEEKFDFVVSSMVIDQITSILFKEIRNILNPDKDPFLESVPPFANPDAVRVSFWLQHIDTIKANLREDGTAYLSSSVKYFYSTFSGTGQVVFDRSRPATRTIPPLDTLVTPGFAISTMNRWDWHYVHPMSHRTGYGQVYEVEALILKPAEAATPRLPAHPASVLPESV